MSRNFLSCIKGVKDPFEAQKGRWDFPLDAAVPNLVFLSSYEWEIRDPLVWPQERPVSMRVARGLSGFIFIPCLVRGPNLELRPPTSDFLFFADMDLRVPLEFSQGSQASSPVETCKSPFLTSWIGLRHQGVLE